MSLCALTHVVGCVCDVDMCDGNRIDRPQYVGHCSNSKFQILSNSVCYKVSLCENFQRQSCSYIIPTLVEKRRFRQISLSSAAAVRASEKSSIIANRKSTTRFPSSHRRTLCVTPKSPKAWLKTRIFTFVACYFFVAGNRRHFKLNMWVEHSKSQPTDDKTSRNGRGHVT